MPATAPRRVSPAGPGLGPSTRGIMLIGRRPRRRGCAAAVATTHDAADELNTRARPRLHRRRRRIAAGEIISRRLWEHQDAHAGSAFTSQAPPPAHTFAQWAADHADDFR